MQNLTTWLEVIELTQLYFDYNSGQLSNITRSRLNNFINQEQSVIMNQLIPYFGNNLIYSSSKILTINLLSNKNPDILLNPQHIQTVNKITNVYQIIFETSNTCKIIPDFGATLSNQSIASDIAVHDEIVIKPGFWNSNNFQAGDVIYLSVVPYEPLLIDLVTKAVAAKALEVTTANETSGSSMDASNYRKFVKDTLKDLLDPNSGQDLLIKAKTTVPAYIEVPYQINEFGDDVTTYSNE